MSKKTLQTWCHISRNASPPQRRVLHQESKFSLEFRKWTVTWLKKDSLGPAADDIIFERGTRYNLNPGTWAGPQQQAGCREYTLLALLRVQVDERPK